ncbi:MAG TPA: hypothetical protein VHX44_00025 [Planctomycetota bacterium]|nr:hypothetical protein [Planctomycetota bacterium]
MSNSDPLRDFGGFIGPENLLSLVRNTAPYWFGGYGRRVMAEVSAPTRLIDLVDTPFGWLQILRHGRQLAESSPKTPEAHVDYFALCLACHMSTVATFVPTDVDTKIRDALWHPDTDRGALERMAEAVLAAKSWDQRSYSVRWIAAPGHEPVGGHDGEWLGVAVGALGCFLRLGDTARGDRLFAAIDAELAREAAAFRAQRQVKDGEVDLLRLAAILTHNVGDVDQGLRSWREQERHLFAQRLGRLAHENTTPYDGTYQLAARLYKELLAAEGHRHYPLRDVRALRSSVEFLLPLGPCFDDWGRKLGSHPDFNASARGELLATLIAGCRKVPGQLGYYRAIAGLQDAVGNLDVLAKHLPGAAQKALKDTELRKLIAIKQISFESTLKKRTQALLA